MARGWARDTVNVQLNLKLKLAPGLFGLRTSADQRANKVGIRKRKTSIFLICFYHFDLLLLFTLIGKNN